MSREWSKDAFRAAQPVRVSSGLSRSLAKALFGAAIGTMPVPALAADDDGIPASAAVVPAATAATPAAATPPAATTTAQSNAAITLPVAASAEQRSYGPQRPGLGTPANTMAPGEVSIETGFVDWQRDDTDGVRSDTLLIGATTVRVGLTRSIELMAGWIPFGHVRTRDTTGDVEQANRVGDATLGFKANLSHPDGSGLSAALQPFVVIPTGRTPVGVGDWGAGLVAPVSYDLSKTVNIAVTGEVDAATNSDGKGRHLGYSIVGGVSLAVSAAVKVTGELSARRDDDPVAHLSQAIASLSLSWAARDNLQFDVGSAAGLNHDSPAVRLYGGISRRF